MHRTWMHGENINVQTVQEESHEVDSACSAKEAPYKSFIKLVNIERPRK